MARKAGKKLSSQHETTWTRTVCAELELAGAATYPLIGSKFAPRGWPDRYIHSSRWCGFIEFKGIDTPLEKHQRQLINELNRIKPQSVFIARLERVDGLGWSGCLTDTDESVLGRFTSGKELLELLVLQVSRSQDDD